MMVIMRKSLWAIKSWAKLSTIFKKHHFYWKEQLAGKYHYLDLTIGRHFLPDEQSKPVT